MPALRSVLVLATRNPGKVADFRSLLAGLPVEVVGLDRFPDAPETDEMGTTFAENALRKAWAICRHSGLPTLADDSGLEVAALGGGPGVRSARYVPGSDADRWRALLAALRGVPREQRGARFVAAIALVVPDGRQWVVEGACHGSIGEAARGSGGFGYDPVFYFPDGRSMAELSMEERGSMSHRGGAMRRARMLLTDLFARSGPGR